MLFRSVGPLWSGLTDMNVQRPLRAKNVLGLDIAVVASVWIPVSSPNLRRPIHKISKKQALPWIYVVLPPSGFIRPKDNFS